MPEESLLREREHDGLLLNRSTHREENSGTETCTWNPSPGKAETAESLRF